jgi:hypothetical protein
MDEHGVHLRIGKGKRLCTELNDPAVLECSFGAIVGNKSAICQMGPIASNGRLTGIEVLAPKYTPLAARTTTTYKSARAPRVTGIRDRRVRGQRMRMRMEEGLE